jgi:hypothetical protein
MGEEAELDQAPIERVASVVDAIMTAQSLHDAYMEHDLEKCRVMIAEASNGKDHLTCVTLAACVLHACARAGAPACMRTAHLALRHRCTGLLRASIASAAHLFAQQRQQQRR